MNFLLLIALSAPQVDPEESLKSLKAAEGLEVELWAHEPAVNNPTAIDIDSRGRVWIAEGLNYRLWKEGPLKRVPGADRIKILEDTDGDGRADKTTVFADDIFPVPMGLAIEEIWRDGAYRGARVYVGNSPDLLVLEDADGDDRAERRYPLLTGFKGIDSDHGTHGMALGPDGRLYFTHGDARYGKNSVEGGADTFDVTDASGRRLRCNQYGTTLRVNLDGTGFEVLSTRQRNNYETSVDSFGHVFTSDNDDDGERGSRTLWLLDGGNYGYKMSEAGRLFAEERPGIVPKLVGTGNGAPCGILVYEGDLFPDPYRYAVIQLDSGTRRINVHPLTRHGAAFRTKSLVLLRGEDPWFRPIDAAVAPDGSVFVCDWYDAGVGGNRFSDQTTGRIYRIKPRSSVPHAARPEFGWIAGAVQALRSPNVAARFAARKVLLERGAASREQLLDLHRTGRLRDRARSLFVLADLPGTGHVDVIAALKDPAPEIRELALRILVRDASRFWQVGGKRPEPRAIRVLDIVLPLASDPDAGVRRELILALADVATDRAGEALHALALSWDGTDRFYLEALRLALKGREPEFLAKLFNEAAEKAVGEGWGTEPVALPPYYPITTNDAYPHVEDAPLAANGASKLIGLAWVLERPEAIEALRRILVANQSPELDEGAYRALNRLLDPRAAELLFNRFLVLGDPDRRQAVLRWLGSKLRTDWKSVVDGRKMVSVFETALVVRTDVRIEAIRMIARSGAAAYAPRLMELAADEKLDLATRAEALEALGKLRHGPARELAARWIEKAKGPDGGGPLAAAALSALSDPGRLEKISLDDGYPLDFRRRAVQRLAATRNGARRLLDLREAKRLPEELVPESTFLLHNHPEASIRRSARQKIPLPRASGGKQITDLDAILALRGDTARGRRVFHERPNVACSRCHQVQGAGSWVGPDLSSIGAKYGKKEMLYHILNPSGAISYNYVAYTFGLSDGRILSGLIADETPDRVVLKTAQGERLTLPRGEIERKRRQNVSIMPGNLIEAMTEQDLADLLAYLATLRRPVSTVGEYYVFAPVPTGELDETADPDLKKWRRAATSRDGFLEVSPGDGRVAYAYVPVSSSEMQEARLVLNTAAPVDVRLNGRTIPLSEPRQAGAVTLREGKLALKKGSNSLLIRLSSGPGLITTLTSDTPLRFEFDRGR